MSADNAQICRFEPLRSLAFGSISGTYAAIGTPLAHSVRLIKIDNTTNANVTISFDGVNDHLLIVASSSFVMDIATNRISNVNNLQLPCNTTVYVAGTPGSGTVYVSVMYASQV